MKILIIEDEPKVASFIQEGLVELGYDVEVAYEGISAERMFRKKESDLVVLDIILPFVNGLELCRKFKELRPEVPILMLTALGTTEDKLVGFESGADDYLIKPFEFLELAARIKALSKRISTGSGSFKKLKVGELELDLEKKVAFRGGNMIELTAKEYALLEYFMQNKEKVVSRVEIAEKVWDITFDTGTNVVDVYVNILRKKIDKDYKSKLIHTRIGMGYYFGEA